MQKIILTGIAIAFSAALVGSVVTAAHGQTTTTTPSVTPTSGSTGSTSTNTPGTPNTGRGE